MRIIKTQQDLDVLHHTEALSSALLDQVEDYFVQLKGEVGSEFCLGRSGYIVVLEAGDNVSDLGNVGLGREDGGLLGSCPGVIIMLAIAGIWLKGIFVIGLAGLKFIWDVVTFPIVIIYKIVMFFVDRRNPQRDWEM